jgi:hypothetical protein
VTCNLNMSQRRRRLCSGAQGARGGGGKRPFAFNDVVPRLHSEILCAAQKGYPIGVVGHQCR